MKSLRKIWSSTDFGANELTRYASAVMCREARQGIFVLGMLTMVLMAGLALLYHALASARRTRTPSACWRCPPCTSRFFQIRADRGPAGFPWLEPPACWFLHLSLKLRQ